MGLQSHVDVGPSEAIVNQDPATTNPDLYTVVFENDRVRVLEYRDKPGDKTTPHRHPDSVMYTLSPFRRRIAAGGQQVNVELTAGQVRWLGAQEHSGENVGDTDTHTIFIELKGTRRRTLDRARQHPRSQLHVANARGILAPRSTSQAAATGGLPPPERRRRRSCIRVTGNFARIEATAAAIDGGTNPLPRR